MTSDVFSLAFASPEHTAKFAERIAALLQPGDTLLLAGDIGAGKTHFARCLIQSLQDHPEDIPSPSFTLIQTYETSKGEVLHADLYRLSGPDDIAELGLWDAFGSAICLVEWPDRLGQDAPAEALTLTFETADDPDTRHVTASATSSTWLTRLKGFTHA